MDVYIMGGRGSIGERRHISQQATQRAEELSL